MNKVQEIVNETVTEREKASWDAGYRQGVIHTVKLAAQTYKTDQLRGMTAAGFIRNFACQLAERGPDWIDLAKMLTDSTVDA